MAVKKEAKPKTVTVEVGKLRRMIEEAVVHTMDCYEITGGNFASREIAADVIDQLVPPPPFKPGKPLSAEARQQIEDLLESRSARSAA